MFSFSSSLAVGLDISDLVLRVVALHHGRLARVVAFQELLLPAGLIVEGEIREPRVVAERLRILLDHATPRRIRARTVSASLPDRRTFVKLISLPKASAPAQVEKTVLTQLTQHFPFSPEDVYLDWAEIQTKTQASAVVATAPRPLVDQYVTTLRLAGFEPAALEMESLAIARAVLGADELTPTFIVDLGGTRTTALVTVNGVIQFSSSLPLSGGQFTQVVAQVLHISTTDAERLKVLYGLTRGRARGTVARALQAPVAELCRALVGLLRYYANHFSAAPPIQRCVLTGGGAQMLGLAETLAAAFKVPVSIGDPARALQPSIPIPRGRLASFTTAIGTALHPL